MTAMSSIGIVSALPSEGKTAVATAFADFAANTAARTLLIDADPRNPSIKESPGPCGRAGFAENCCKPASALVTAGPPHTSRSRHFYIKIATLFKKWIEFRSKKRAHDAGG
jgi:hypothetical protein